jgi:hypothetical protein
VLDKIKRMLVNLFKENKKLFYIIGGSIALPLALAVVVGAVFAIGGLLLWLGMDVYQAITLMTLMIMGAIGGYLAYEKLLERD